MKRALVLLLPSLAAAEPAPPSPMPARLLRTLAHRPEGYGRAAAASDLLLGDLLFHSPSTLGPRARAMGLSCQSCHPNGAAHGTLVLPGISPRPGSIDLSTAHFRAGADDGIDDAVDIPSLRGVRYTGPYGRDGRTASLAEFTAGVVTGEFDGAPLAPSRLAALTRYLQDLDFLPNRLLDGNGRLADGAGEAARRGERLFQAPRDGLGGASCATCHPPSSYFRDGRVHRVGSGAPASPWSLDDGFETPTLLGTAESAPYFHDGRFSSLAAVVDWFDATFRLGLAPAERADLTAYLAAVGAVDARADERPLARRLTETFAYLALLVDGEARDDRAIWAAAIDLVDGALAAAPPAPSLRARVEQARASLGRIRERAAAGAPLAPLRDEVARLREELPRLAADWTGALSAGIRP